MSCGGKGKSIAPGDPWVLNEDNYSSPTYKQSTECDEGYLARAGNAEQELAGGPLEKNKIQNVSIPVGADLSVNVQLTLTPGSLAATNWENGTEIQGLTFNTTTGKFAGTIKFEGKYSTTITAKGATGVIDTKGFQLIAQKASADEGIKFIHPMPGSVITCRCTASVDGTKIWDDPKRDRPHKGIDLAFNGGKTGNVRAAASGEVIRAVSDQSAKGYGNVVYIGHKNASGKKLCITVYGHLASVAVKVGQQVSAGDFIGVEGNTGHSSGAHLHFEIRSPEFASSNQAAAVYDPAAYISGSVLFDDKSVRTALDAGKDPDPSKPDPSATKTVDNGKEVAITPAMADNKCSGYTPEPGNPGPGEIKSHNTSVTPSGKCLDDAINFTLKHEVGPWFNSKDQATIDGLCDTYPNRRKCGYVDYSDRLGGVTKYGIAHKYNSSVNMITLNLAQATEITKTKYWAANKCDKFPYPMCVIHFDSVFALGSGNAAGFLKVAFGTSSAGEAATKATAMSPADLKAAAFKYINARQNAYNDRAGKSAEARSQINGWTKRTNELKAFCN